MANGSQAVPTAPAWIVNVVDILMSLFKQQKANGIWAFIRWRKMIAEACLIFICFWGTAWRPMLAILVAALGALRVRDIQLQSRPKTAPEDAALETATDGLAMAAAMIGSQLYFVGTNPAFATLNSTELAHGVSLSILVVSVARLLMNLSSRTDDLSKLAEFKVFRTALRINVLLMLAAGLIAIANENAVPGGFVRNVILAMLTLISMGVSCRYQRKSGRLFFNGTDGTRTLMNYNANDDSDAKAESLPQPISLKSLMKSSDAQKVTFFRLMFVACVNSTTVIAIWRWFFGDPSRIRWPQILANTFAFTFLIVVWHIVTFFNLATAARIQREAAAREAREKILQISKRAC
jgi:hypothetical protein